MYRSGTVTRVANNEVFVKPDNGEARSLPHRPDKHWVRPSQTPAPTHGQTATQPAQPVRPTAAANPAGLAEDDVRNWGLRPVGFISAKPSYPRATWKSKE